MDAVFAVLVTVRVQPGHEEDAQSALESQVVPGVRQAPGVVTGTWLSAPHGRGLSVLVFEDEASTRAAAERAANAPMPDHVTFESPS
jgi:hypothetical protein